jgi:hypothetical protein
MDLKRVASAATIAAGVGISTLMFGVGPVNAVPLDPPPSPTQPAPGGPGMTMAPTSAVPHSGGGGPHSGGGSMTETTKTP